MTTRWMSADAWLAAHERNLPARQVCLGFQVGPVAPPERRRSPVGHRWPTPPAGPSPWPELVERIDQVVDRIREKHKRKLAGRRAALLEDRALAREVYELIRERGIADAITALGISRQALVDMRLAHGRPAPLGTGNRTARRTA